MLKKIIIVRGQEASGKTTLVKALIKEGTIKEKEVVIKDQVAGDLGYTFTDEYTEEVAKHLYSEFYKKILRVAQGKEIVLVEAPFSGQEKLAGLFDTLGDYITEETIVKVLTLVAKDEVRKERALQRKELVGFSRREIDNRVPFEAQVNFDKLENGIQYKVLDVTRKEIGEIVRETLDFLRKEDEPSDVNSELRNKFK